MESGWILLDCSCLLLTPKLGLAEVPVNAYNNATSSSQHVCHGFISAKADAAFGSLEGCCRCDVDVSWSQNCLKRRNRAGP